MSLPTGTVTFLFTDIEGSTRLWEEYPEQMRTALQQHDNLLRQTIEQHQGIIFKTMGDAFCAVFVKASDAIAAAIDAQRRLNHGGYGGHGERPEIQTTGGTGILEPLTGMSIVNGTVIESAADQTLDSFPQTLPVNPVLPVVDKPFSVSSVPSVVNNAVVQLKVRMALHTGVAEQRDADYFGQPLNRLARLLAIGHGGQILLSQAAQEEVHSFLPAGAFLADKDLHGLKDLQQPEHVWQLCHSGLPDDFPPLRSLDRARHNLPLQTTSFIGREAELTEIQSLLSRSRLLTLTGPGGIGKTRLSLQVAANLSDTNGDGVWLVELASLTDPTLVPSIVASVLGVREERDRPLTQTLLEEIKTRRLLLILDNCEHVLGATAALAEAILRQCPDIRILASSREALGIFGEQVYRVPSLGMPPDPDQRATDPEGPESPRNPGIKVKDLLDYESVRLFADRAGLVKADFSVTEANTSVLARLCHRLDGIPFALELAAARVRVMPVEQIESRLDDCFRLLTGGSRTALPRQQTLRALIDWSYDLLTDPEKLLLIRLSVFSGGWTLDAAEAIASAREEGKGMKDKKHLNILTSQHPDTTTPAVSSSLIPHPFALDVLDLLSSLVDKSLVVYEDRRGEARYRLLETVRQYSQDKLRESGQAHLVREQHQTYFLRFIKEAAQHLESPEQVLWLDRIEIEHDNIRGVLDGCIEASENANAAQAALEMSSAMWRFWEVRGYLAEGRERLMAALKHPLAQSPTKARSDALNAAGNMTSDQGNIETAQELYEEGLALRRTLDDRQGIAASLANLGNMHTIRGEFVRAQSLFEEALAINRSLVNRRWEALNLINLGLVNVRQGLLSAARAYFEQALRLNRELDNRRGLLYALHALGSVALDQKSYEEAQARYVDALMLCQELGDQLRTAQLLNGLAALAQKQTRATRAVRLYGAEAGLRDRLAARMNPASRKELEERLALLQEELGENSFAQAWAEGKEKTWEQAIAYALGNSL